MFTFLLLDLNSRGKWFTNHSIHIHIFTPITWIVATDSPFPPSCYNASSECYSCELSILQWSCHLQLHLGIFSHCRAFLSLQPEEQCTVSWIQIPLITHRATSGLLGNTFTQANPAILSSWGNKFHFFLPLPFSFRLFLLHNLFLVFFAPLFLFVLSSWSCRHFSHLFLAKSMLLALLSPTSMVRNPAKQICGWQRKSEQFLDSGPICIILSLEPIRIWIFLRAKVICACKSLCN